MRFNNFHDARAVGPFSALNTGGSPAPKQGDVLVRVSRCRGFLIVVVRVPVILRSVRHRALRRLLRSLNRRTRQGYWRIDPINSRLVLSNTLPLIGKRAKFGEEAARFVAGLVSQAAAAMPAISAVAHDLTDGQAPSGNDPLFGRN